MQVVKEAQPESTTSENDLDTSLAPDSALTNHNALPEPWSSCFDTVRRVMTITSGNAELVDTQGRLDLSQLDGYPCDGLTTINISGLLSLKESHFEPIQALAQVTSLSITNTRLRSSPELLTSIASAMPGLKELDFSGSMLTDLTGVQSLVVNGLQRLRVQGANISDITALVDVAEAVHNGTWSASLALEDIDLRDNAIEKVIQPNKICQIELTSVLPQLPPILGFLPLRSLLVDNNAFLAPPRRVWEREGTKGLLQWLMDRA